MSKWYFLIDISAKNHEIEKPFYNLADGIYQNLLYRKIKYKSG